MRQRQQRQGGGAGAAHCAQAAQAHKPTVQSQLSSLRQRAAQRQRCAPLSGEAALGPVLDAYLVHAHACSRTAARRHRGQAFMGAQTASNALWYAASTERK